MSDPFIRGFANEQAALIADYWRSDAMLAFTGGLKARADLEQRDLDKHPMICDENAQKDWRYRMGFIAGVKFSAGVPQTAVDRIEIERKKIQ